MDYRRDIDGLRGVAVSAVILFHSGFISGGFVGVDVFFVISGFLIGSNVTRSLRDGSFDLVDFYERRARRILPALLAMMLCIVPLAWVVMLPAELEELSKEIVAAALFVSNFYLWQDSGYFSTAAELKPLLHLWSLAVEEQFYLLLPLAGLLFWRLGERAVVIGIVALGLASFGLSVMLSGYDQGANFYLLPSRAWELVAGMMLVWLPQWKPHRLVAEAGVTAGLVAVASSALLLKADSPFPGVPALPAVLGAAMILYFGRYDSFAARLLSWRPIVGLGLISYSAYLWHQPLFAFARIYSIDPIGRRVYIPLIVLTLVLAALSWWFVELPFRKRSIPRKRIFISAAAGVVAIGGFGLLGLQTNGFDTREQMPKSVVASLVWSDPSMPCADVPNGHDTDGQWFCSLNKDAGEPQFFVFGDSHAMAMFPALEDFGKEIGMAGEVTAFSGCAPLLGVHALRADQDERNCFAMNNRVFQHIRDAGVTDLFLIARWTYYTDGGYTDGMSYIAQSATAKPSKPASREAFEAGVFATVKAYGDIGVRVHFVGQAPEQIYDPGPLYRQAYVASLMWPTDTADFVRRRSVPAAKSSQLQSFVRGVFDQVEAAADVIDLEEIMCGPEICPIGDGDRPIYWDNDHLNPTGAGIVMNYVAQQQS